jgi:nucleoside-diphosphate-sugar epimerase
MSLRRVVVLGASGYLGRALVRACEARGIEAIGHSSNTLDLRRPEALGGLDGVLDHEAALVLVSALTPDKGQNVDTFMTNLAIVGNVGRYLETRRAGLCAYLSSDAVYGFDLNPVDESTPTAPAGYYALAKYAGERLLQLAGTAGGTPVLILRATAVYGPGDPHGAYGPNVFARSLAQERGLRLFGAGEEERDHIYVDDAAQIMASLVAAKATGVFNIATGESRSFSDVVETIRALVPYDVRVTSVPRKAPITHRRYDIGRLRQAVPDLSFTPFKDGLRATLAAFGAL